MGSELIELNNYTQWNADIHDEISIDSFCCLSSFENGIYRISSGSVTIDFFFNGFDEIQSDVCLVFFQGAITNRDNTSPPYFTGTSIAKELGHPYISISDPTISLDNSLTLSWYAGNKDDRLVPYKIARVLDYVAGSYGLKLVLLGGSGGGFAVLVQSCILSSKATAIAWNPQTSIENYSSRFVSDYMTVAFHEDWVSFLESKPKEDCIKYKAGEILGKRKILHSVVSLKSCLNVELIYLQNKNDWHVKHHLKPYIKKREVERICRASFSFGDKAALYIGDWGKGHAPPPREVIKDIIQQVTDGSKTVREIARKLSLDASDNFIPLVSVDREFNEFSSDVCFNENGGDLEVSVLLPEFFRINKGFEFAIYFYKNNERLHACWYQEEFKFNIVGGVNFLQEVDAVKIFVKDVFGDAVSKYISLK